MCESVEDIPIPHPDEYRDLSNDRLLELTTYLRTEMLYRRAREKPEQVMEQIGNLVARGDQAGRAVTLLIDRERSLIDSGRLDPSSPGFFLSDDEFHHLVKIIEQACYEFDVEFQPIFEFCEYPDADLKEAIRAVERLKRHLQRDDAGDEVASKAAQDATVPAGQAEVGDAVSTEDPADEELASGVGDKKLTKWMDAKAIADEFGWDPARVRSELTKAYYGPDGAAAGKPVHGKAQWRVDVPNAGGSQPKYLWNTTLVIPYLETIFQKDKEKH